MPARLVLVGTPHNRRVTLFQAAATRAGVAVQVLPWRELAAGPVRLPAGAVVRVDSPGEEPEVDRLLRATVPNTPATPWAMAPAIPAGPGAAIPAGPGAAIPAGPAARVSSGEIVPGRADWYAGLRAALRRLAEAARTAGATLLNDPDDIAVMFDKPACHTRLAAAGVPVPPALPAFPPDWAGLRAALRAAGWSRAFVKPAHGSSASGVLALQLAPGRIQATSSVELAPDGRPASGQRPRRAGPGPGPAGPGRLGRGAGHLRPGRRLLPGEPARRGGSADRRRLAPAYSGGGERVRRPAAGTTRPGWSGQLHSGAGRGAHRPVRPVADGTSRPGLVGTRVASGRAARPAPAGHRDRAAEACGEGGGMLKDLIGSHDVLLVTLDTLRYDVAAELARAGRTPNLVRALPGGQWERRHSPASFTYAAHQAFFAGFLPTPTGPGPHQRLYAAAFPGSESTGPDTWVFDAPDVVTALDRAGYHTVCVGGVGFFNPNSPLGGVLPGLFTEAHWEREFGVTAPGCFEAQLDRIAEVVTRVPDGKPLFLFVNVAAIHQPNRHYLPGADKDSRDSHAAALEYVDRHIGRLFALATGRGRPCLTMLCADHGTAYGEDGHTGHRFGHEVVWTVPYAHVVLQPGDWGKPGDWEGTAG